MSSVKARIPLSLRRAVKIARVLVFETLGSTRYSWPALYNLDTQVDALFDAPGIFLEIGANDGYSQSNTWFLERHKGWHGILIEALPAQYRYCKKLRSRSACYNVACIAEVTSENEQVVLSDSNLTSLVLGHQDATDEARRAGASTKQVTAPASTLSAVIDSSPFHAVDFMSVDVEGAELSVLAGLDLARHLPRYLLVETDHPSEVDEMLASRMELVGPLSFHDYLWRARTPSP